MTLLKVLATPETIIKMYVQKKFAILIIHVLKENTKIIIFCRIPDTQIFQIVTVLKLLYLWFDKIY